MTRPPYVSPVSTIAVPVEQATGVGPRIGAHVALTKPRIIELLLVTAVPTMMLAAGGVPSGKVAVAVLVGGTLAAGGANTLNSVYDRDIDALMRRTSRRPAPLGLVSTPSGIVQGLVLTGLSALVLWWLANPLSALLAILAVLMYAVGYTMILKRRTSQNIVWGGAAGCMPVLIAWSATTNSLSWTPVILFLIIFFWTPPHYWPLAMKYRDDYAKAGIPMLPVVTSDAVVARSIIMYAWALLATTLVLIPVASMGWVYSFAAVGLGVTFLGLAYRLRRSIRSRESVAQVNHQALRLFHGSITYLSLLFLAIGLAPFVP
jgi:protoheme IX farnesyltransferase